MKFIEIDKTRGDVLKYIAYALQDVGQNDLKSAQQSLAWASASIDDLKDLLNPCNFTE